MHRPLLLGHRGARAVRSLRENTPASFDRALADGCDGFEFDVRLTADGEAVVCHDPKFGRIEVSRASAGRLSDLPRLGQVLERYKAAFLDIELKVGGLETAVIDALRRHKPPRFVVSSFLPEVLEVVHKADATIPLGLICETKGQLRRWNQFPIMYVIANQSLTDRRLIQEAHGSGKKVLVWTVNAVTLMMRFAEWQIDGIISDNTTRLCRALSRPVASRPHG
ncbi:MAG TPA: glycerophosphodiester phosphodiesterase [Verrucomicrobiae bacterium]|nr:glycerophosphodiester phosphodiesterase [Verrucomicrobiae bacterium]